jgi:hypothetical protein
LRLLETLRQGINILIRKLYLSLLLLLKMILFPQLLKSIFDSYGALFAIILVPDHESRDRDVVLVRRTIHWETLGVRKLEWGGNGNLEWGGGGQFMINLGPRWTRSHHGKGWIPSK